MGIAAFVLVLLAVVVAFFAVKGMWRWGIRQAPDLMVDWPGGPWVFGVVCGLVAVGGVAGGLWVSDLRPGGDWLWVLVRSPRPGTRRTATPGAAEPPRPPRDWGRIAERDGLGGGRRLP
ncbi:hypothetical protein [Streptomyces sp. MZ04]|uniref:hypothetical protein n=1 Tax=Streptomyces sp. MZ04 TaxID=2559236 RepID=UPI00107E8042|nr:hypothetical protein [Streptomyces sp. MZ04]TGB06031.1 hypothetical protein E2651_23975 [Streptomyces sp. MZ04]